MQSRVLKMIFECYPTQTYSSVAERREGRTLLSTLASDCVVQTFVRLRTPSVFINIHVLPEPTAFLLSDCCHC